MLLGLAVTLIGAVTTDAQKSVKFEYQNSQARVLDVSPTTYVKPLISEVIVDTSKGRIRDEWKLNTDEFLSRSIKNDDNATIENLRTYAVYKSSEKHDCDLIVAATFDIRITENGATISIVGYPANFANWKTGTVADYDWILKEPEQRHSHSTSIDEDLKKKK